VTVTDLCIDVNDDQPHASTALSLDNRLDGLQRQPVRDDYEKSLAVFGTEPCSSSSKVATSLGCKVVIY
jgi:hypothetical protein